MLITHHADCIETMKAMPENCVDSIVTDPPYELGFMGKSWDASGIAFNVEVWQEALRVLKPGGFLLAFSGSRTYHRMAVAIEDAGFEIRDQIMWVYGSGFPKSHDVSKAIHKASDAAENAPFTEEAKQWQGWGTALKPAHEPIVVARKPLIGTVAENVLTFGTGGLNIDGARIGVDGGTRLNVIQNDKALFSPGTNELKRGYGQKVPGLGRWPANFIHDGSDEVLDLFPHTSATGSGKVSGFRKGGQSENSVGLNGIKNAPDDFSDSGCAARFFYCAKASKRDRNDGLDGFEEIQITGGDGLTAELREDGSLETASAGGKYGSIKAKKANHHPTVKPTMLMQYLVRLVTPPNGIVLDPFMGSGSTGKACVFEGFSFIGIDQSAEYVEIANARIKFAKEQSE